MSDDSSESNKLEAIVEATEGDYVLPENRESVFVVEICEGSYPDPDGDPAWTKSTNEREMKKYKHHISRVEFVVETLEEYSGPRRLCSHGSFTSGDHVEALKDAWEEGETNQDCICHDCWKKLPAQLKEDLRKDDKSSQ